MHFATLASGSSGNSILVGEAEKNFLVDSGISAKSLIHSLAMLNIPSSSIEGIVITHEHSDHVKGVGVLARKLGIPIYATQGIWDEIKGTLGKLKDGQCREIAREFSCAGLQIRLFPTSHDSRESYGLKVERHVSQGKVLTLGIATDSGTITEEMNRHLSGCDALIVEANHDKEKLWQGRYPWSLKKRVDGIYGHLENTQIAEGLLSWIDEKTQRVVLAHLSEENNTPELALATIMHILKDSPIPRKNPELRLRVAPRHIPHELIHLRED